jgi:nitrite reductase (NADH) large subunit
MLKTHVIIGLSAAGVGVLNTLRTLDAQARIIGISDQADVPYNKCVLVDYCVGLKSQEQVTILSREKAHEKNIELLLGMRVIAVNPQEKTVFCSDGTVVPYTTLFIGTGTSALVPQIPGIHETAGIFTFHTLADVHHIQAYVKSKPVRNALVIGAGLSGLECADALTVLGVKTTVIDKQSSVLPSHITLDGSRAIECVMASHNATFYGNTQITAIKNQDGAAVGVTLADGSYLPVDMIVIAVGARPNLELAHSAGLALEQEAIVTNEYMQTSIPDIYAGGDVALVYDQLTGQRIRSCLWPDAMMQGMIAAHNMAGKPRAYPGAMSSISSAFFGIKFVSCGPIVNPPRDYEVITRINAQGHQTFLVHEGLLKGFALIGDISLASKLKRMLLMQQPVTQDMLDL